MDAFINWVSLLRHGSYNLEKVLNFGSRLEKSFNLVKVLEKYLISLLGLEKSLKFNNLSTPDHFWEKLDNFPKENFPVKMVGVKHEHVNDATLDLYLNFMHKASDEIKSRVFFIFHRLQVKFSDGQIIYIQS